MYFLRSEYTPESVLFIYAYVYNAYGLNFICLFFGQCPDLNILLRLFTEASSLALKFIEVWLDYLPLLRVLITLDVGSLFRELELELLGPYSIGMVLYSSKLL